ncbi:MAG: hypothetical protein Q8914_12155, partial [Bacteroidota bacterium]|nr:hypothetical protein [Bacteroidota bacterium]
MRILELREMPICTLNYMKGLFCVVCFSFLQCLSFYAVSSPKEKVVIDLQNKGASVSPSMYGAFFEEINHAGDGGLYAELVQNRSFEETEMPDGFHVDG